MLKNKKNFNRSCFIGGHLIKKLLDGNNSLVASDIKPKEYWFQDYDDVENQYSMDIKKSIIEKWNKNIDYVFSLWPAIWRHGIY